MKNASGLKLVLLFGVGIWLLGMVLLSRATQSPPRGGEVVLPVYPGASQVRRQNAPNVGFQSLWCRVQEKYPSLEVLQFYSEALGGEWHKVGSINPTWSVAGQPGRRDALLVGRWEDEEGLRQIEFRMWWQEKEGTGSDVYVMLSRGLPASGVPPDARSVRPRLVR